MTAFHLKKDFIRTSRLLLNSQYFIHTDLLVTAFLLFIFFVRTITIIFPFIARWLQENLQDTHDHGAGKKSVNISFTRASCS